MISVATLFAVLVIPSAATWAEVGEKNIATLRQMNELSQSMKGSQVTPQLMQEMSEKMMAFFQPEMSCHGPAVHLEKASPTACFLAVGQRMSNSGNLKIVNWVQTNLAIDPASGGKTILTYQPGAVVGTSMDQKEVPGTKVDDVVMNYLYEFNDAGLIQAFTIDFDTSILQGIANQVQVYNAAMAKSQLLSLDAYSSSWRTAVSKSQSLTEKANWQEVGQRNMATVQKLDAISKQLIGKHITPAALGKLAASSEAFYAPAMTCVTAKASGVGVHLVSATHNECFQAVGKAWSNTRMVDFDDKHLAIDPNTGGTTILTRMVANLVGVNGAGQEIPGTNKNGMVLNFRYKFNTDGLVDYFEQEFDSGIVRDVDMKVGQTESASLLQTNAGPAQRTAAGFGFGLLQTNAGPAQRTAAGFGFGFFVTLTAGCSFIWARRRLQRDRPSLEEAFLA